MKSMQTKFLLAGVARRVISPKPGGELAGFDARKGVSTGIHDDLFASALVITGGEKSVALISLDLIGITQAFTDSVRRAVSASTGMAEHDIILAPRTPLRSRDHPALL